MQKKEKKKGVCAYCCVCVCAWGEGGGRRRRGGLHSIIVHYNKKVN